MPTEIVTKKHLADSLERIIGEARAAKTLTGGALGEALETIARRAHAIQGVIDDLPSNTRIEIEVGSRKNVYIEYRDCKPTQRV